MQGDFTGRGVAERSIAPSTGDHGDSTAQPIGAVPAFIGRGIGHRVDITAYAGGGRGPSSGARRSSTPATMPTRTITGHRTTGGRGIIAFAITRPVAITIVPGTGRLPAITGSGTTHRAATTA